MFKRLEPFLLLAGLLVMFGIVGNNDYADHVEQVKYECARAYGDKAQVIEVRGMLVCRKPVDFSV